MYKVKYIADGMIIWKGSTVIGIKGMTLPAIFDDCDCYKLPGNAFDYALSPHNKYTEEQLAFINKADKEWAEPSEESTTEEDPCDSPWAGAFSGEEPEEDPDEFPF